MMNSRDYSYIDEEKINTLLKCPICSKPFVNPVVINKATLMCLSCIPPDVNDQTIAPVAERLILFMLDNLSVKCNECNETNIRRVDLEQHMRTTCSKRTV